MQHTSEPLRTRPFHFKVARLVRVSVIMGASERSCLSARVTCVLFSCPNGNFM